MDTSNSPLHISVVELRQSVHHEYVGVANRCEIVLRGLLESLIPILRFVCEYRHFDGDWNDDDTKGSTAFCLLAGEYRQWRGKDDSAEADTEIYLRGDGEFFSVCKSSNMLDDSYCYNERHQPGDGGQCWQHLLFDELIAKLRSVLLNAEVKCEEHRILTDSRIRILNQMLELLGVDPDFE